MRRHLLLSPSVNPSRRLMALLAALLLAGCAAPPTTPPAAPVRADTPMTLASFDGALLSRDIFTETNRVRAEFQLKPFAPNPGLDAAADEQTSYMALVLRAAHTNPVPGERNVSERVQREGVLAVHVGENAIMKSALRPPGSVLPEFGYAEYARILVDAWMNSPDHRANILNPTFSELGCSARLAHGVLKGDERVVSIQVFVRPPIYGAEGTLSR